MNKGVLAALGAYLLWGVFPLYWRMLNAVPSTEILAHRVTWSFIFLMGILAYQRRWRWIKMTIRNPKTAVTFIATAALLAINWYTYIWGVNAGYVVETSLGYFINPLVNVLLGALFLGERLRKWQWPALLLAIAGVLYMTISYGALPWISLILAFSFGTYGLLRKKAVIGSVEGLSLEMMVLLPIALLYLVYLQANGAASFGTIDFRTTFLLAFAGVATAVPLLLFAVGARNITLTTLGILQYVAPSMQLAIGVFIFNEDFPQARLIGFGLIWIGLIIYAVEGIRFARQR